MRRRGHARTTGGRSALWLGLYALCCALLWPARAAAGPISHDDVPPELRPWIPWVLDDGSGPRCLDGGHLPTCVWPGLLTLELDAKGGSFALQVVARGRVRMALPGSNEHWPQAVEVDATPAVVLADSATPQLGLEPGEHEIRGRFVWTSMPESLAVPGAVAQVRLSMNGQRVAFPKRSDDGSVWLHAAAEVGTEPERLDLEVFRRIGDGVPLDVRTEISLRVAGKPREVNLGNPLLEGSTATELSATLPVRLEPNGDLLCQVRAGQHTVTLRAIYPRPPDTLPLAQRPAPWPETEIWTWAPDPVLRQVQIAGGSGIDPSRTNLPTEWKKLQALSVTAPATVTLTTTRRGEPEPPPNSLRLGRQLWLDFDGRGFTVQDVFRGGMSRSWRLDLEQGVLGHVTDQGLDQLITVNPSTGKLGVELRSGNVQLGTEWRLDRHGSKLPAVGWSEGVQSLHTLLHLPPGWQLLYASGIDAPPLTWFARWSLLDAFLVLLIAAGAWRLFGRAWGALALVTLALTHGVEGAPRFTWLAVVAAAGLLTLLRQGKLRRVAWLAWLGSAIALTVVGAEFVASEVGNLLHPISEDYRTGMLERELEERETAQVAGVNADNREGGMGTRARGEENSMGSPYGMVPAPAEPWGRDDSYDAPTAARVVEQKAVSREGGTGTRAKGDGDKVSSWALENRNPPKAVIQTGPGVPSWRWSSYTLAWTGPVSREQMIRLVLLSPLESALLALTRVLLVGVLAWLVLRASARITEPPAPTAKGGRRATKAAASAAGVLAGLVLLCVSPSAAAQMPSSELLSDLKERLTRPPDCGSACVTVPRVALSVEGRRLKAEIEVHAGAVAAVKLPGPAGVWIPSEVRLDGQPTSALALLEGGFLHLRVGPGTHQVEIEGPIATDTLALELGESPHHASMRAPGWEIDGISEDGSASSSIQLTRKAAMGAPESPAAEGPEALPPWFEVQRVVLIGVKWNIMTTVLRRSAGGVPAVVRFPLLAGEQVVTSDVLVERNEVVASFDRTDSSMQWTSSLEPRDALELRAAEGKPWTELWKIECSPIWRCDADGLAPFERVTGTGVWLPAYRPWPGETVTWHFSAPAAATGTSITIDGSQLVLTPGSRLLEAVLSLSVRSSSGGTQPIELPADAKIQRFTVDGQEQPVPREGNVLSLSLKPGAQRVAVHWQQPESLGTRFRAPRVGIAGESVNARVRIELPGDRWIVALGGPTWGPSVALWGRIVLLVLVALVFSRLSRGSLRPWQWALLAVGFTAVPLAAPLAVAAWLLLVERRKGWAIERPRIRNLAQIGLIAMTVGALLALALAAFAAVTRSPNVIEAFDSTPTRLSWYQDRIRDAMPTPSVVSVPAWVWEALMLAWALWAAWLMIGRLRAGWEAFNDDGAWRPWRLLRKRRLRPALADGPEGEAPAPRPTAPAPSTDAAPSEPSGSDG